MRAVFKARLRIILCGVLLFAAIIAVRLYFVEIVHGADYSLKGDRQYVSAGNTLYDRGSIYFTRKDGTKVSAATLTSGFVIAINPKLVKNPDDVFAALVRVATSSIDRDSFIQATKNPSSVYVEVAHHLTNAEGKSIAALKLPGIQVLRERWTSYPGNSLGASTIGIVAKQADDDTLRGRTGLEASYEDTLSRGGDGLYKNFFAELFSSVGNALVDARDAREGDVVTTLEPQVETRLMNDLGGIEDKYHSKESGGIIMDPKTGAIIAMGSVPTYDANDTSAVPSAYLTNPLASHVYEFGSIMKPLTMASALDAGVVTPETTYNDTGCLTLDTATICNFDRKARGVIPMQQILSQSLNVGASFLAQKLGPDRFRSYFLKLGFDEKTGIDLPAEASGLVSNLQSPRAIEFATASFGQGIAMTPVEMIRALGALANGGAIVSPHLGNAIELNSGISKTINWDGQIQVFSATSTREVSEMLTHVVDNDLSHGAVKIPTMSVAAKTGTAQLTKPGGGYYSDHYFHSFFGYFPSYAPRFIILLYTYDPQGVQYASETLTTTFMDLTHFLIDYYAIPPDRGISS